MARLLCIDTAMETATVGLCNDDEAVASITNTDQKSHAAFVQSGIQNIMQSSAISFAGLDAVAVVNGPGSYTGLRVGLASAKGICYASGKPLILINTLEVMALAAIEQCGDKFALYCPMIDARRNEVFAALYDHSMQSKLPPQPIIIHGDSFADLLSSQKIYFFGNGAAKTQRMIKHENAVFVNIYYSLNHINKLAQRSFSDRHFYDVAYAEPFYTKEFYTPAG